MQDVVKIGIFQFGLIYLLLIIVLVIMKRAKINQSKLLIIASLRMTIQLVLAGFILSYVLQHAHPAYTVIVLVAMILFTIWRVLSKSPNWNLKFKIAISCSIALVGIFIVAFFLLAVVNVSLFNPQYAIPISGMIFGNTMTGMNLALQSFEESLTLQRLKTETLLNVGVAPQQILLPYVNTALETALLPTINSMLGMGIVFLPGMMTGQILAGALPTTAITYQIAIVIAICASVCLTVFCSLRFGYKTLYNQRDQITYYQQHK